jgi:hypothetical protein
MGVKLQDLFKYVPKCLFFATILKSLIFTPDWPSAVICLGSTAAFLFCEYYSQMKKLDAFRAELETYKTKQAQLDNKTTAISDSLASLQVAARFNTKVFK